MDKAQKSTNHVTLNHEVIGKDSERITKVKHFINNYTWEGIHFPLVKNDWKKTEKINRTVALNSCILKKKKYILLMFQNITQIVKDKFFI